MTSRLCVGGDQGVTSELSFTIPRDGIRDQLPYCSFMYCGCGGCNTTGDA